jgi:hypothetical protein
MEAEVDHPLGAASERCEESGDEQRRGGDRERVGAHDRAEDRLQDEVRPEEREGEHGGHRRIADRPADDPVDLVQPVAQDRDPDAARYQRR